MSGKGRPGPGRWRVRTESVGPWPAGCSRTGKQCWTCRRSWPTAATSCPAARTQTLNRLHRLLAELIPGGASRHLTASQAKALLASVRSRDLPGRTRRELAVELAAEALRWLRRRLSDVGYRQLVADAATTHAPRPRTPSARRALSRWDEHVPHHQVTVDLPMTN
jgi:hypothetical protein